MTIKLNLIKKNGLNINHAGKPISLDNGVNEKLLHLI